MKWLVHSKRPIAEEAAAPFLKIIQESLNHHFLPTFLIALLQTVAQSHWTLYRVLYIQPLLQCLEQANLDRFKL